MAALTPALGVLGNIVGTVKAIDTTINTLGSIGGSSRNQQQDLALQQLQERQALQTQIQQQQSTLSREKLVADANAAENKRLRALKRAVASRKVGFGAQNIGTNNGSAEAVLLGLFEESEDEAKRRSELDSLKVKSLDQELQNQQSLNLLQVSQLKAQHDLNTRF